MTRIFKNFSVVLALAVMAACTGISEVPPGPFEVDKAFKFNVSKTWSAYPRNSRTKLRPLTIDGTALNSLYVGASIEDGKSLIYSRDREKIIPLFRSDMSESEVVEFVADSLSYGGMQDVTTTGLRPVKFGTIDGVWFDLSGATASGLNISGMGKAAIEDDKLHLIIYTAPSEYYFDLHKEEVESIMASVSML